MITMMIDDDDSKVPRIFRTFLYFPIRHNKISTTINQYIAPRNLNLGT